MPSSEEKLTALLADLQQLSTYLHDQGNKKLALARRFEENARKDSSNRDFDLNQSRMLDYQHSLWHEIGNLVDKLLKQYDKEE